MAVVTLIEAAKLALNQGLTLQAGMIMTFLEAAPLLNAMSFQTIAGNALQYNLSGALPGIAFRGINESYTPTVGVINPQTEALRVIGGELNVDTAIVQSMGLGIRAQQEKMQATAIAQKLAQTFIKGNQESDPREFDGLERRLTGAQVLSNSDAANGGALSVGKLDELMDATEGGNALLMLKKHRRKLNAFMRDSNAISMSKDEFGRQFEMYNGHRILIADAHGTTPQITEDEEYTGGGTADGSSIYCLHIEEGWLSAIQNGVMRVANLGELQAKPAFGTRIEWLVGFHLPHPRAAARLRNIDAALAAVA